MSSCDSWNQPFSHLTAAAASLSAPMMLCLCRIRQAHFAEHECVSSSANQAQHSQAATALAVLQRSFAAHAKGWTTFFLSWGWLSLWSVTRFIILCLRLIWDGIYINTKKIKAAIYYNNTCNSHCRFCLWALWHDELTKALLKSQNSMKGRL